MKRCKIPFKQARVHAWLAKHGPATNVQIAAAFNLTTTAAQKCTARLEARGCATRSGPRRNSLWTATGPRPEDMRGTSLGSQQALMVEDQLGLVRRMLSVRGLDPTKYPRLSPLSKCSESEAGVSLAAEGAASKAPRIPSLAELLAG